MKNEIPRYDASRKLGYGNLLEVVPVGTGDRREPGLADRLIDDSNYADKVGKTARALYLEVKDAIVPEMPKLENSYSALLGVALMATGEPAGAALTIGGLLVLVRVLDGKGDAALAGLCGTL